MNLPFIGDPRYKGAWFVVLLAGALWINLNSGLWLIPDSIKSLSDVLVCARVYAPYAVLLAGMVKMQGHRLHLPIQDSPLTLLAIYGVVCLAASTASPDPRYAIYWSVAFLATVVTCQLVSGTQRPAPAAYLLLVGTWLATLVVAIGVAREGRTSIFGSAATGYAINLELNDLSRSSGVARWAAVAALVLLLRAFYVRWWPLRALLLAGFGTGLFIVYRMQSRGAVFGFVAALLFIAALQGRVRALCLALLPMVLLLMADSDSTHIVSEKVMVYLERGQTEKGLYSLGGRTAYYEQGWEAFHEAPILGRGPWADRLLGIGHIHNSFLEALLSGGVLGFVPYLLSWFAGWRLFFILWSHRDSLLPGHRIALFECGATMAFFTVRAIPETTTASYEPDLLIMCAVYAYLSALVAVIRATKQPVRRPAIGLSRRREEAVHA